MAMYSALRDAFNDLNRNVKDQVEWEEKHAADRENKAAQRMIIESNLEDQVLRRDSLKLASMKAIDQMTPKDANAYNMIPDNAGNQKQIFTNSEFIKGSEQIMGGKWDPSVGGWRKEDGNLIQFNDYRMAKKMAAINGLAETAFNGPAAWTEQGYALDIKISDLQLQLKGAKPAAKKKIAKQLSDFQQQRNVINSNLTDGNMLRYYNRQFQRQTGKARFFLSLGDPATAALMQKGAAAAQTNVTKIIEQMLKEKRGGKGTGTTSGHDVYAQKSGNYQVGNVWKWKEKNQWVRNVSHNFKEEGDITRKLREGETLVRDLVPKGGGGLKGVFTFKNMIDTIDSDVKAGGFMGDITEPEAKVRREVLKQIAGHKRKLNKGDHAQAYLDTKNDVIRAEEDYWNSVKRFDNMDDKSAGAIFQTLSPAMQKSVKKRMDKNNQTFQEYLKTREERLFRKALKDLSGGRSRGYKPSTATRTQIEALQGM